MQDSEQLDDDSIFL